MAINKALVQRVNEAAADPKVRAYLDLIARSEGTYGLGNQGYNVRFGGNLFQDYSGHPIDPKSDQAPYYTDARGVKHKSSASGRYQITRGTWNDIASRLGLTDFSPQSQDKAAIALILRNKGAMEAIRNDDPGAFINAVKETWASMPGSVSGPAHGGQTRTMNQVANWLNASMQAHGLKPYAPDKFRLTSIDPLPVSSATAVQATSPSFSFGAEVMSHFPGLGQYGSFGALMTSRMAERNYGNPDPNAPGFAITGPATNAKVQFAPAGTPVEEMTRRWNEAHNPNSGVSYGLSDVNGQLMTTRTTTDPNGGITGQYVQTGPGEWTRYHSDPNQRQRFDLQGNPIDENGNVVRGAQWVNQYPDVPPVVTDPVTGEETPVIFNQAPDGTVSIDASSQPAVAAWQAQQGMTTASSGAAGAAGLPPGGSAASPLDTEAQRIHTYLQAQLKPDDFLSESTAALRFPRAAELLDLLRSAPVKQRGVT